MAETITRQYLDMEGLTLYDTKSKDRTNQAITTAVANADHLKRTIVDELPEIASADQNTIYMVKIIDGSGNQKYEEFMLIDDAFEKIGDSAVDLTDYATKAEVQTAKGEAQSYADGLASNYATAEQGTKADSALQKADIEEGATNGTIKVKGDDVIVHGLGTAAYKAEDYFDKAGVGAEEAGKVVGVASNTKDDNTVFGAKAYADDKVTSLANGTVATNASDIATLKSQVATLESVNYTAITEEQINTLFTTQTV